MFCFIPAIGYIYLFIYLDCVLLVVAVLKADTKIIKTSNQGVEFISESLKKTELLFSGIVVSHMCIIEKWGLFIVTIPIATIRKNSLGKL